MKMSPRLNLELATHPVRNRRLFFISFSLAVVVVVALGSLSLDLYFGYAKKLGENRSKIENLEQQLRTLQGRESQMTGKIEAEAALNQSRVDRINDLIYSKSFSWIEFLSDLEEALPDRSYIVSLAPAPRPGLGMEVRIKVASTDLNDLLLLYSHFGNMGFKNVLIRSEDQAANGEVLADVSFNYERNF